MKLNMRQRKFVDAYIQTASPKESARIAGYSDNEANLETRGSKLLADSNIQQAIALRYEELARKTEEKVSDVGLKIAEIKEGIENLAKNAESEAVRLKAYELAGRMQGLLTDKLVVQKEGETAYQRIILEKFNEDHEPKERLILEKGTDDSL
jgi:hypothetical protein